MQNQNPMKRALWSAGAVLAVALSVFGISIANRKVYPSYASAAAANADASTSATAASQVQGASGVAVPAPAVAAKTSRSGEENESESEDEAEGGGYVPRKSAPAPAPAAAPSTPTKTTSSSSASTASPYKDGTYEAVGTYDSPAGSESIDVTLTLKGGVVTDASVTPMPNDHTSARYQDMFVSGYKSQVIGQPIATLNLDYVSGSSLTPIGFDNAVAAIKAKAKA